MKITINIDKKILIVLIIILLVGVTYAVTVSNDDTRTFFDSKNISNSVEGKELEEILDEGYCQAVTLTGDFGSGIEAKAFCITQERIIRPPIPQPKINTDDINCAYGDDICYYDNGTAINMSLIK